jgi:hypothetical protein
LADTKSSRLQRRRTEFFSKNPYCCFCGGRERAVEEDHVPARAIFENRHWPEGYNFPACKSCNAITRQDENVVAYLSRLGPTEDDHYTPNQKAEIVRCMAAMIRAYPEAMQSTDMSANEVRRVLRAHGIPRPPGTFLKDIPLLKIDRPEFRDPIRNFGIKLFCALHYKHVGSIVTPTSEIGIRFMTNMQINAIPDEMYNVFRGRPIVERSKNELNDQFHYMFAIATEKTTSAYLCKFRQSFLLSGVVSADPLPKELDEDTKRGMFKGRPFDWSQRPIRTRIG